MKKFACIFPGQGSQEVGMAEAFMAHPSTADIFKRADEVLGINLSGLMSNGPASELALTYNTQPAILATSIAAWTCFRSAVSEKPVFAAGHSLGEFSALTASSALDFETAISLVRKRGELMQDAVPSGVGAMAALIGGDDDRIRELLGSYSSEEILDIANFNAPGQSVISGHRKAVESVAGMAGTYGFKRVVMLDVSAPFHSRLMGSVREKFMNYLGDVIFSEPLFPVVHNVTAEQNLNARNLVDLLSRQIDSPVRWVESVESMIKGGVEVFLEMGHGNVLQGLVKKIAGRDWNGVVTGVSSPDDVQKVVEILQ